MDLSLGQAIQKYRILNNYSLNDLSLRSGISLDDLMKIEKDELKIDLAKLSLFSTLLNTDLSRYYDNAYTVRTILDYIKDDDFSFINKIRFNKADNIIENIYSFNAISVFKEILNNNMLDLTYNNLFDNLDYIFELSFKTNTYIKLLSNKFPDIGAIDINKIPESFYINAIKYATDLELDFILNVHNRDLKEDDYKYMPFNDRHTKGNWQRLYPKLLKYAIDYEKLEIIYKIYNAMSNANHYAVKTYKDNKASYKLCYDRLDKYEAQNAHNLPVTYVDKDLLEQLLKKRYFDALKAFNKLNKDVLKDTIDDILIQTKELNENSNELDYILAKYFYMGLLNIKDLANDKSLILRNKNIVIEVIKKYPISYIEYAYKCIDYKNYKELFAFSVDYELEYVTKLLSNAKFDEVIPYFKKLFSYHDIANDNSVNILKANIRSLSIEAKEYNNSEKEFAKRRCYEKISRLIDNEKENWLDKMLNYNTSNLNSMIYEDMLNNQLNVISFQSYMVITDFINQIDNLKNKVIDEILRND